MFLDLRALPFVNASYKAIGDSGYLEGTRMDLINEILAWANALLSATSSNFFVLRGAAGTGKSTIAREICHRLHAENRLGASFFFIRSDTGALGSMQSVIPTLAYQLASLQPALGPHISRAAREFMKLQSGSPKEQMESLILKPCKSALNEQNSSGNPIVIVLDALDEAGEDLGNVLAALKILLDSQSRFRVLVITRPERSISHAFRLAGVEASKTQKDMENIPQAVVESDIQHFLTDNFRKLQWGDELSKKHPDAISKLTKRSEGLFIYARTAINHLAAKTPEKAVHRLTVILDDTGGPGGLSALDKLYTSVLRNAYDEEDLEIPGVHKRVIAVLAGLVVLQEPVTIKVLAPLMGVTEDDAARTVEELRSIISCAGSDLRNDVIRPLHLTLREFLVDKDRCKNTDFLIDRQLHHSNVAESCLRIMTKELHRDMCQLGDVFKDEVKELEKIVNERIPPHVQYACVFWSAHSVENEPSAAVRRLLGVFCKEKLLEWLETMSLMNRLRLAIRILLTMHSWTKVSVPPPIISATRLLTLAHMTVRITRYLAISQPYYMMAIDSWRLSSKR
jgi:hypothetical protein